MLRSIGLTTRISESEVGVLAEFRVSHLEIRLQTAVELFLLGSSYGTQHKPQLCPVRYFDCLYAVIYV